MCDFGWSWKTEVMGDLISAMRKCFERDALKVHTSTINRNENMVWTDFQDYGADEILNTTGIVLFNKTVG